MGRRFFVSGKPVASTMMLMQNEYKFSGELMAMSIMQGGPAPNLFSQNVFDYQPRTQGILLPYWGGQRKWPWDRPVRYAI